MEEAYMFTSNGLKSVHARDLTRKDKKRTFICKECKQLATLCICSGDRSNYFMSNQHTPGCHQATGGKIYKEPADVEYDIAGAMMHKDKPIPEDEDKKKNDRTNNEQDPDDADDQEDPVDNMTDTRNKELHSCSSMFKDFIKRPFDTVVYDKLTIRDIFVCRETIENARRTTLKEFKMIVTIRCQPPFDVPQDYVCLRDAYTLERNKAIYVLVRCAEPTVDNEFRDLVMGNKKKGRAKDPQKYIVVMGYVEKVNDDTFTIYRMTPLSTHRYHFTNIEA